MSCTTGKYTLFYDNFKCGFKPEQCGSPYVYFSAGDALPAANDAAGGVTAQKFKLTINSTPFTYTNPTSLDHVKYLVLQKDPYNTPRDGAEIVYEGIVSFQQTGLTGLPADLEAVGGSLDGVSNVNTDARLSTAAFNVLDPETFLVFDFVFSNEDIYAVYERLPFGRTEWGGPGPNYQAFTHMIPVGKRNVADPLNDYMKVAIAYNYKENYVRWILNDVEVYRINRIAYPLERKFRVTELNTVGEISAPVDIIRSKTLQFGFGTFSLMDFYNPQNPGQNDNIGLVDLTLGGVLPQVNPIITNVDGTTMAASFISPFPLTGQTGTNFGQGGILKLKYVTVYLQAPDEEHRKFEDLYCCRSRCLISRCAQNRINGVNSSSDTVKSKCRGHIKDCDDCASKIGCDCPFADDPNLCHHRPKKCKHKCKRYAPHSNVHYSESKMDIRCNVPN